MDYSTIAQETLSEEEFSAIAPFAFQPAKRFPQELKIVGFAKVFYTEEQKNSLQIYEKYPELEFEDLVIILSDGERFHHVGLSLDPTYTGDYFSSHAFSVSHFDSQVSAVISGSPMSLFSHSTFLSYSEQVEIFWGIMSQLKK